jgi:hypothetical protein
VGWQLLDEQQPHLFEHRRNLLRAIRADAYANCNSNCDVDSYRYAHERTQRYTNNYSYAHAQANAYCQAQPDTEISSHPAAAPLTQP